METNDWASIRNLVNREILPLYKAIEALRQEIGKVRTEILDHVDELLGKSPDD